MSQTSGFGPCTMCGATGYALSFGGPGICPACDAGINPEVSRLRRELTEALAGNTRLAGRVAELEAENAALRAKHGI